MGSVDKGGWVVRDKSFNYDRFNLQRCFRLQAFASMCIMHWHFTPVMNLSLIPEELRSIADKIETRQRISEADALQLFRCKDLNALGVMATAVREQKNGNFATYIHNRYINYSNICILSCQFCAFAARKRDAHAFEYAIDEIVQAVTDALPFGVTEVHMVGGLHPSLEKEWYLDLLGRLRALDPQLHIKAFTC